MEQLSISREVHDMIQEYKHEKLTPSNQYAFAKSQASITQSIKEFAGKGLNSLEIKEIKKFLTQRAKIIQKSDLHSPVKDSMIKVIDQLEILLPVQKKSKMKAAKDYFSGERQKAASTISGPKRSHQFKSVVSDDALSGTISRVIETAGSVRAQKNETDEMRNQAKIREANLFFTKGLQMVKKHDREGALKNLEAAAFLDHPRALHLLGAHHLFEAIRLENIMKKNAQRLDEMDSEHAGNHLLSNLEEISHEIEKHRGFARKQLTASANAGIEEARTLLWKYFPEERM